MNFPRVQHLTLDINSTALINIHNAFFLWSSHDIQIFIGHIREIFGKSWEKNCGS